MVETIVDENRHNEEPTNETNVEEQRQSSLPPLTDDGMRAIDELALDVVQTCYDPEIPVNIYELGLIYQIRVARDRKVHVTMTLTSPSCPAAQSLPTEVKEKIKMIDGVEDVDVEIVWDPPWGPHLMSESAKLELGFF